MKRRVLFTLSLIVALLFSNSCWSQTGTYKDGVYKGKSRSIYTDEPFWGKVTLTIRNGKIAKVDFIVIDSTKNEVFNEKYEKHYEGNKNYIQQCRNDWNGIQVYPTILVEKQKLDEVDAISGATWSFNLLNAAIEDALKGAKK